MKNNTFKGVIIGASATLLLTSGIAYAADYPFSKKLNAVYNNIKVIVDGEQKILKDGNGKTIEPFIVDGTTYLPVRGVANAFGKNIEWDSKSASVYIGEKKLIGDMVPLENLKPWEGYITTVSPFRTMEIAQEDVTPSINQFNDIFGTKYLLKGEYTRIKAKLAATDGVDSDSKYKLSIIGDDNTLYESPMLSRGNKPTDIDLDITGINELRFIATRSYDSSKVYLYDVTLQQINSK